MKKIVDYHKDTSLIRTGSFGVVRISNSCYKSINDLSIKHALPNRFFVEQGVILYLKEIAKKDSDAQRILDEIDKKSSLIELRKKHKEYRHCMYIIKNTQKTLYEQQKSFYFNSGKLNMKIANRIIDQAKDEYDNFPEEMKKVLKEEMEFLDNYRDPDFLTGRIGILRQIEELNRNKTQSED